MKYVIDIDKTICTQEEDYREASPLLERIDSFNKLYDEGHTIIYFTARGTETGIDWRDVTENQFAKWGVKYHELLFGKPSADFYIDDKAINVNAYDNVVDKIWGQELWLKTTERYAFKKLMINKGSSIHLQMHIEKDETWYINKGVGRALINNQEMTLTIGDVMHIPPGTVHKITALEDLEILEASTPELYDVLHLD